MVLRLRAHGATGGSQPSSGKALVNLKGRERSLEKLSVTGKHWGFRLMGGSGRGVGSSPGCKGHTEQPLPEFCLRFELYTVNMFCPSLLIWHLCLHVPQHVAALLYPVTVNGNTITNSLASGSKTRPDSFIFSATTFYYPTPHHRLPSHPHRPACSDDFTRISNTFSHLTGPMAHIC